MNKVILPIQLILFTCLSKTKTKPFYEENQNIMGRKHPILRSKIHID